MRVLWITNILFPDISEELHIPAIPIGGWMYSSAQTLIENCEVELAVAATSPTGKYGKYIIKGICYYLLPLKSNPTTYVKKLETCWKQIEDDFQPDVIHIHGTEFSHGLACLNVTDHRKVVVSIQGLVSVYERYYYAGMEVEDILSNITFRDIIRNDNIFQQRKSFQRRGKCEKEYILNAFNIIGRTQWDKSHVMAVNPNVNYFFCNETLRTSFYHKKWDSESCEPYSIFLSQASYPIKGLHQVLKAMPSVLRRFPQTKLYVGGVNPFKCDSLMEKIKFSGYGSYVKKLIEKLGVGKSVFFLGMLNEDAMNMRYLKSNVFVCPSAIENSPNSLGEAQLLGVPCIASYVGGVPDMVESCKSGLLYRFEEVEMLADCICEVFSNKKLVEQMSEQSRSVASQRHDREACCTQLYNIYCDIIRNKALD